MVCEHFFNIHMPKQRGENWQLDCGSGATPMVQLAQWLIWHWDWVWGAPENFKIFDIKMVGFCAFWVVLFTIQLSDFALRGVPKAQVACALIWP